MYRIGSLQPAENHDPQYLHIYFVGDEKKQAEFRCTYFDNNRKNITLQLERMIHNTNSYVKNFKSAIENSLLPSDIKLVINAYKRPQGEQTGRFKELIANEVTLVMSNVMSNEQCGKRDIVLKYRDNSIKRIAETQTSYGALQDRFIYVYGEDSYNLDFRILGN